MWPCTEKIKLPMKEDELEIKTEYEDILQSTCDVKNQSTPLFDFEKHETILRVLRVTAWIFRIIKLLKGEPAQRNQNLTSEEILEAERYWIREIQVRNFGPEIKALKNGKDLERDSAIVNLNPFLDDDNLLRVGGRIQKSEFSFDEKHPVILPTKGKFTELIITSKHKEVMHCGVADTLSRIRNKYWIPRGRQAVRKVLRNCIICKKYTAKPATQISAPLPRTRIQETPPFHVTGVDHAGPLYTRGNGREKSYITIFTCAVTRAVHLELVSNLTTDNFLLAFRRFLARRGHCSILCSDNSKTFKRAEKELKEIQLLMNTSPVPDYLATKGVSFRYIVPNAPFWGGFWERMVRSVKTCLRKTLGRALLTFEELSTLLSEVEAILNSRPLTYTYDEVTEPEPLTPAHFLNGKDAPTIPAHYLPDLLKASTKEELTKRKRYRQTLIKRVWSAWKNLYLMDLRTAHHQQGKTNRTEFKENDFVLIQDEKKPKFFWKTGLVIKVHPGRDGKIRSCCVKTADGNLTRPIQRLCRLELDL